MELAHQNQVLVQTLFVKNNEDDDDDDKINESLVLFVSMSHCKYALLSNCHMKKRKLYWSSNLLFLILQKKVQGSRSI